MSDRPDPEAIPPEGADEALAGEYVLRLLGPEEHAAAARREATDPAFAAAAARWRADLEGLDAGFAPVEPPPRLRARTEARLFRAPASSLGRLWASAGLWRGLAVVAGAAAAWLALPLAPPPEPGLPAARLVSAVAPAGGTTAFLAVYDADEAALSISRTEGEVPAGRVLELWVIAGEAAPVSLGVLPEGERARVPVSAETADLLSAGAVLAVSDEPPGGSPTGAPTGTVLSAGALEDV